VMKAVHRELPAEPAKAKPANIGVHVVQFTPEPRKAGLATMTDLGGARAGWQSQVARSSPFAHAPNRTVSPTPPDVAPSGEDHE